MSGEYQILKTLTDPPPQEVADRIAAELLAEGIRRPVARATLELYALRLETLAFALKRAAARLVEAGEEHGKDLPAPPRADPS